MRHSVWLGHGDDDPRGIDLNDDVTYEIVENGLDLGTPDATRDRRTITLYVRIVGRTERRVLYGLHALSRWVTRAAQREAGTVAPLTLRLGGGEMQVVWYDVVEAELVGEAQAIQYAARGISPVVRLTLTARAFARALPVTLIEGAVVDQAAPVLVLPPVETDAPAPLEVDLDDLTEGGTGVNRWTIAALPVRGTPPALVVPLTLPDPAPQIVSTPVTLTASGATATGTGAVTISGAARVQAPLRGLSPTEGWIAIRLRPAWASSGDPLAGSHPYAWSWADSGTTYLLLRYRVDLDRWEFGRAGATVGQVRAPVTAFGAGDGLTLVARWSATEIALSLNGGPFDVVAHSDVPGLAATLYDIGSFGTLVTTSRLTGDVHWFAAGAGTITEAEAATLAGLGDTDPTWATLPAGTVLRWAADTATDAEAPTVVQVATPDEGTLDGRAPAVATVGGAWRTIRSARYSWDAAAPPPRAVEVWARAADLNAVAAPARDITARAAVGGIYPRQHVTARETQTLVFGEVAAGTFLAVAARCKTGTAFSWPAGWTLRATASNGGWRQELATRTVASAAPSLSLTVTTADAATTELVGVELVAVDTVVGTATLNAAGTVALPGTAAYQATLVFAGYEPWAPPQAGMIGSEISRVTAPVPTTVHPLVTRFESGGTAGYTAISTAAPGSVRWEPGRTVYTPPVTYTVTRPNGTEQEVTSPAKTTFVPASGVTLVALVLSGSGSPQPASVPAGTFRVGVTGLLDTGQEVYLDQTATVTTPGLVPIQVDWLPSPAAGRLVEWRVWVQSDSTWRYISVPATQAALTITSWPQGTVGTPPLVTRIAGGELRLVARTAPDAVPPHELAPAGFRLGLGLWELVRLGVVPLPLIPGGPNTLYLSVQGRTAGADRDLRLDRLYLVPVHQELGHLEAAIRGGVVYAPLRWRHRIDAAGRAGMQLIGGASQSTEVLHATQLSQPWPEDPDPAGATQPRLRVFPGQANVEASGSFAIGAVPGWSAGTLATVADPAAGSGEGATLSLAAGTTAYGPPTAVTGGDVYLASVLARGAGASATLSVEWLSGAGSVVGTAAGSATALTGAWQRLEVSGAAPSGATLARLRLAVSGAAADVDHPALGPAYQRWQGEPAVPPLPLASWTDNAVLNPSFEDGLAWWVPDGQTSPNAWAATAAQRDQGAQAATARCNNSRKIRSVTGWPVLLIAGQPYTVRVRGRWFGEYKGPTQTNSVGKGRVTLTIAGSTQTLESATMSTWETYSLTFTPASTQFAALTVSVTGTLFRTETVEIPPNGQATYSTTYDWWLDAVRLSAGTSADYADLAYPAPVERSAMGPLAIRNSAATARAGGGQGWFAARAASRTDDATLLDWRADDDNRLSLTLSATQVTLTRRTAGASHTVSVARPVDRAQELVVRASWTASELRLRLHDGAAWGTEATAASATAPDLSAADWRLGNRLSAAGVEDQWLCGHLVMAQLGAGTWSAGDDDLLLPEPGPHPDAVPSAAALVWAWDTRNPTQLTIWQSETGESGTVEGGGGGWAVLTGALHAWDGETALIVLGEAAAGAHVPGKARVSVRCAPRLRYLSGS